VVFLPLPTLLTLGNGVAGLGAITAATGALRTVPGANAIFVAGLLIFLGMLFDMLDGQAARLMKQATPFGAQLDSLCDVITFGAAPVFIVWSFGDAYHPRLMFGIGSVYIACVLMRLARFNVETTEDDKHQEFSGLPSPAAAGTIASFAIALPQLRQFTEDSFSPGIQRLANQLLDLTNDGMPLLTLVLAWLMVSRIRYPHVVNQWIRKRYAFYDMARGILVVIAAMTIHELALPMMFCFFAFEPPFRAFWQRFVRQEESGSAPHSTLNHLPLVTPDPTPPTAESQEPSR
jgi:CDP-diacylglycerol--serine O-phosphatidyltransferase